MTLRERNKRREKLSRIRAMVAEADRESEKLTPIEQWCEDAALEEIDAEATREWEAGAYASSRPPEPTHALWLRTARFPTWAIACEGTEAECNAAIDHGNWPSVSYPVEWIVLPRGVFPSVDTTPDLSIGRVGTAEQ
jgi:hypothetical protein